MNAGVAAAIFYGVLAIGGGIIGYLKTQSTASIISGGISGFLLLVGGVAALVGLPWGLFLAGAITALLILFFAVRYNKTRKFVPAGVMAILGIGCLAVIFVQIRG